jgi:hypothetical protein
MIGDFILKINMFFFQQLGFGSDLNQKK